MYKRQGMIRLTGMEKYKGGVRIQMLCGFRALADALEKERNVYDISAQLSAKPYEVAAAVEKLKNENCLLYTSKTWVESRKIGLFIRQTASVFLTVLSGKSVPSEIFFISVSVSIKELTSLKQ